MLSRSRSATLWGPVVAYMGLLFALSSISQTPSVPAGIDKNVHGLLYAGLSALTMRALSGGWRMRVTWAHVVLAIVISTAYGVSDEWHQSFVPPREADARDVVADAIGAAVAACGLFVWSAVDRWPRSRGV